jgi:quercetin 2,3-dioxygenase
MIFTMLSLHPAAERGRTKIGWLDSRHSFSFGDYHDPRNMGYRALRVINDDRVAPGAGFDTHFHRDMEILSYVLEGALEHKDNLGTGSVIRPGDAQRMSAGTGVMHSEWNHSASDPVHFLQIWILPERRSLAPGYEQKTFDPAELDAGLRLVASHDGRDGSVTIHQDVNIFASRLAPGAVVTQALLAARFAWLQIARGSATLNGMKLAEGDGASASDEPRLHITSDSGAEIILFDLA